MLNFRFKGQKKASPDEFKLQIKWIFSKISIIYAYDCRYVFALNNILIYGDYLLIL